MLREKVSGWNFPSFSEGLSLRVLCRRISGME